MKIIDLTGSRYGHLTVIERNIERSGKRTMWTCVCDCGKRFVADGSNIRSGKTRSCGCRKQGYDITGERFGRMVAVERVNESGASRWRCVCDCGNEKIVLGSSLKNGSTKSCGCLQKEAARKTGHNTRTHGETTTRLYRVWQGIKRRIHNPHTKKYPIYGGRGIQICPEWDESFEAFKEWAMSNGYNPEAPFGQCTIDRIDVNGDYEPLNCRWVNLATQARNRRKAGDHGAKICPDDGCKHAL